MSVNDEQRGDESARGGNANALAIFGAGLAGAVALNALIYVNLVGRLPDFATYGLSALAWLSPPLLAWCVFRRRATEQAKGARRPGTVPRNLTLFEIVGQAMRQRTSYFPAIAAIIALAIPGAQWSIAVAPFVLAAAAVISILGHSFVGSRMRNALRQRHFQRARDSLRFEIDDLRAAATRVASEDVVMVEAGQNARSAAERRGLAKEIAQLRKTQRRVDQLLEIRYNQRDIIESYLHQLEITAAVSMFALPSREELLREAAQAVEHAESVADASALVDSLDQSVSEAVGEDVEMETILAEFEPSADGTCPSEEQQAPATPSIPLNRLEFEKDSAPDDGPVAE